MARRGSLKGLKKAKCVRDEMHKGISKTRARHMCGVKPHKN